MKRRVTKAVFTLPDSASVVLFWLFAFALRKEVDDTGMALKWVQLSCSWCWLTKVNVRAFFFGDHWTFRARKHHQFYLYPNCVSLFCTFEYFSSPTVKSFTSAPAKKKQSYKVTRCPFSQHAITLEYFLINIIFCLVAINLKIKMFSRHDKKSWELRGFVGETKVEIINERGFAKLSSLFFFIESGGIYVWRHFIMKKDKLRNLEWKSI